MSTADTLIPQTLTDDGRRYARLVLATSPDAGCRQTAYVALYGVVHGHAFAKIDRARAACNYAGAGMPGRTV